MYKIDKIYQIIGCWNKCFKNAFKKVSYKASKATGESLRNKIANKFVKTTEEIIIPQKKRKELLNELMQVL